MISWMSVPDAEYTNPTVDRGWQHCLSIPRELTLVKKKLIQYPIEEMKDLRMDRKSFELKSHEEVDLGTQVFEAQITPEEPEFEIWLRKDVHIRYARKVFSLACVVSVGIAKDIQYTCVLKLNNSLVKI
jgi:beta-fructofuranosidase